MMRPRDSETGVHPILVGQRGVPASRSFLSPRPDEALDRARKAFHREEYEEALELVDALIRSEDETRRTGEEARTRFLAAAEALKGRVLRAIESREEAESAFRRAAELYDRWLPGCEEPQAEEWSTYGMVLYRVGGRDAEARRWLERALSEGYTHASTHRYLGLSLLRMGELSAAERQLRTSLALAPVQTEALTGLAECLEAQDKRREAGGIYQELAWVHFETEDLDKALQFSQRAVELDPGAESELSLGIMLNDLGDQEGAVEHLSEALREQPDQIVALVLLGETLGFLGRTEEALEYLDRATDLDPASAGAHITKGEALRFSGRPEEAIRSLDRGLELDPGDARGLSSKAAALLALERPAEALDTVKSALDLDPEHAFGYLTQGRILHRLARDQEAVEALQRAIEMEPAPDVLRSAREELVNLLQGLDRHAEALEVVDDLLRDQPDQPVLLTTKADLLRGLAEEASSLEARSERHDEALAALDQALELAPEYGPALSIKGRTLFDLDRYQEAIDVLRRALQVGPELPDVRFTLAESLRLLDRFEEALAVLDVLQDDHPDDHFVLGSKGEVLRVLLRHEESGAVLDRALELQPDYVFGLGTKGRLLYDCGHFGEAVEVLQRAVQLKPDRSWTRLFLGESLRMMGRYDEALPELERIVQAAPDNVFALAGVGEVLRLLERYDESFDYLERALSVSPEYPFACGSKGSVLLDCGEYELARKVLTRAIELDPQAGWCQAGLAFAVQLLGHFEESERASRGAVELEPDNMQFRSLLADTLYLQERLAEAKDGYQEIVLADALAPGSDVPTDVTLGWCHFRLGNHDEALHRFQAALSRDRSLVYALFDVALTLMCSRRHSLAVREYERAIQMADAGHPWRLRGLLSVAKLDLETAVIGSPDLEDQPEHQQVLEVLRARLAQARRLTDDRAVGEVESVDQGHRSPAF